MEAAAAMVGVVLMVKAGVAGHFIWLRIRASVVHYNYGDAWLEKGMVAWGAYLASVVFRLDFHAAPDGASNLNEGKSNRTNGGWRDKGFYLNWHLFLRDGTDRGDCEEW